MYHLHYPLKNVSQLENPKSPELLLQIQMFLPFTGSFILDENYERSEIIRLIRLVKSVIISEASEN